MGFFLYDSSYYYFLGSTSFYGSKNIFQFWKMFKLIRTMLSKNRSKKCHITNNNGIRLYKVQAKKLVKLDK